MKTRRYVYTVSNKVSLLALGVVVVGSGTLWIRYWASLPPPFQNALRIAWSIWAIAGVIATLRWALWRLNGGAHNAIHG